MKIQKYIGRKVKVINAAGGVPVGINSKVASINGMLILEGYPQCSLYPHEVQLISCTKENIECEISCLEKEITSQRSKLQYMTENNLEEFDENQYRVFQTLKTLDNKEITQVQKSKIIAELITNKSSISCDNNLCEPTPEVE